jgi:UPF0176 protein
MNEVKQKHTILLYYKYVHIAEPEKLMVAQKELLERLGMKGRIIIAHEGINGTVEGTAEVTEKYVEYVRGDKTHADFSDMHFKRSEGTLNGTAFGRLSVKVRKEIVSAHLDENDPEVGDVSPTRVTGKRLAPEQLRKWYEDGREFTIVDMRNDYEHEVGHFKGSVLPSLSNFRDLPKAVDALPELVPLKKKTVLTVCTGGVRCEKASGYLVERGFEDVYQLDGGIVSYMEKYPGKDFLGSLYVFDNRVTMNFGQNEVIGKCAHCGIACERYVNCSQLGCHFHFICCEDCTEVKPGKGRGESLCVKCV